MPRYMLSHLHMPHFKFKFDNSHNLRMLYGIRVLRELTNNLVFFFVPLFLFKIGAQVPFLMQYGLSDFQRSMIFIGLYSICFRIGVGLFVLPIGKLVSRVIGFKNAFVISRILTVLIFLILKESTNIHLLALVSAFISGIEGAFFWPNFYSVFGNNAKRKRVGEDLGLLQFMLQFVAMAAPAVGGLITVFLGFDKLFLFGVVISMLSLVFAVGMHHEGHRKEPKLSEFLSWIKERSYRRLVVTYIGRYINDSVLYMWPLYVFLILGSIDKVGFLYSLSLFVAMIMSFFIGFYIDHHKSKKPFMISGGLLSLLWFVRMQVVDLWGIALVDISNRLLGSFHWLFYDSIMIKRGSGKRVYPFFIYREMIISLGALILWMIYIGIFIISANWNTFFLIAAVGILASLLINDKAK